MQNLNAPHQPSSMTDAELQRVKDLYEDLSDMFQFHEGLTAAERKRKVKPSRQNLIFVQDSIDAINQVPEVLPGIIDAGQAKDMAARFEQLRYLEQLHTQVGDALKDLRLIAGDEAYHTARAVYHGTKLAAQMGFPKARPVYEKMRERFVGQKKNSRPVDDSLEVVRLEEVSQDVA